MTGSIRNPYALLLLGLCVVGCEDEAETTPIERGAAAITEQNPSEEGPSDEPTDQTPPAPKTKPVAGKDEAPSAAREKPLPIGAQMPLADRDMKNVDGDEVSLSEVAGDKGTLVVFTCNHCPWAQAWHDRIVAIGNTFPEKGVGVIAVNSNDPAEHAVDGFEGMQKRAEATGMEFPYVVDEHSRLARAFGASRTPEAYLFDEAGELVYRGAIDDNAKEPEQVEHRYLKNALQALVAGEPIPVAESKALGCSIKLRDAEG